MSLWNEDPGVWEWVVKFTAATVAGIVGTVGRIYDQMAKGYRTRVFNSELVIDVLGFVLMLLIAAGISEYFNLGYIGTAAVSGVLCRGGTQLLDTAVKAAMHKLGG